MAILIELPLSSPLLLFPPRYYYYYYYCDMQTLGLRCMSGWATLATKMKRTLQWIWPIDSSTRPTAAMTLPSLDAMQDRNLFILRHFSLVGIPSTSRKIPLLVSVIASLLVPLLILINLLFSYYNPYNPYNPYGENK